MSLKFTSAVICGPGGIREKNQDNFYLDGDYRNNPNGIETAIVEKVSIGNGLYAVADGMGGEKHGEIASFLAVNLMERESKQPDFEFLKYLYGANAEICGLYDTEAHETCGTTLVGLYLHDGHADIVNIGDSRAYRFRDGKLSRVTTDHTAISSLVKAGILSEAQASHHRDRHRLSQYLGIPPDEMVIEPESVTLSLVQEDAFILCTDGLYEMVDEIEMTDILSRRASAGETTQLLYNAAMRSGGTDNITALVVYVNEVGGEV